MSWRHAESNSTTINAETAEIADQIFSAGSACSAFDVVARGLIRNGRHLARIQHRQKLARLFQIELGIGRLDAEEEPIAARQREARHVEYRVIRLRQPVQREHAE